MNRETIIQHLSNHKHKFKQEFGMMKTGLFGSFSRGQNHQNSDIDIIVELGKPNLLTLAGIKQVIEEDLDTKVDIVRNREGMNHTLKKRIEQDAVYA